ncbi:MAG: putative toxin-antitoxin system toxin component, PIN family [Deltaproteobacteria bacterium]|nr:MAG: putative toxin-antitoxin system toxin component, PIN family [Deltaproteobacteria bacterium]
MKQLKIVIDTNVLISALRSKRGASHKLLMLVGSGKFRTALSVPLVLEYEEVAGRFTGETDLTLSDIGDIIDYLCKMADHTKIFYLWRPVLKDPDDDMVLELAVSAGCDVIVTYNKKDFGGAHSFGLRVMTAKEFLQEIGEL